MLGRYAAIACFSLLLACSGTSSGNPADDDSRGVKTPRGIELIHSDVAQDEQPKLSDDDAKTFAAGNTRFALDLYTELAQGQAPDANLFVSPFSISTALAMTYAGAEGATQAEMRDALHFDLEEPTLHVAFNATLRALGGRADELQDRSTGQGFALNLVNQAWGQKGYEFIDPFLDVLAEHYGAGMLLVDFAKAEAARELINDWVEDHTEQRVKDLLPEMAIDPSNTKLILTNAIYFKANWLLQFDKSMTDDGTFMAEGGARDVKMMHQVADLECAVTDQYQALELPYLSPAVRMLLILPAEGGDLDGLIQDLDSDLLESVHAELHECDTTLTLPKFSFESENKLKQPLTDLGMPSAFEDGVADFTGINGDDASSRLYIEEVYHKAFVAVDEEGTEAAAATAVVVNADSKPMSAVITFDRPFMFLIYDEPTGQILFIGHLRDPG